MKVRVKNEELGKILYHPQGNIRFREDGTAEWPADSYTFRRIADGDVTEESETKSSAETAPAEHQPQEPEPPQPEEASTKKPKR